MIRKFYHHLHGTKRSLPIEEIAAACTVSPKKISEWFSRASTDQNQMGLRQIDTMETIDLLIANRLPVPTRLLPLRTKKLLLIPSSNSLPETTAYWSEMVSTAFSKTFNILLEVLSPDEKPQLAILAGKPDLVVVLLCGYNRLMADTLALLAGELDIKTLVVVSEEVKRELDQGMITLPAERIVADTMKPAQVMRLINGIFDC
jgi:hypothetical protein